MFAIIGPAAEPEFDSRSVATPTGGDATDVVEKSLMEGSV